MHCALCLVVLIGACMTSALQSPHSGPVPKIQRRAPVLTKDAPRKRAVPANLNAKTEKFYVNGSLIPEVDFNLGESYAGTLSINANPNAQNALWFWYFPSENPAACEEITIWLNGGPGASSLDGLLQENGPFLWQPGTYSPIQNPYSWVNLTNMVWIDQPIGTGFSPAAPGAPKKIHNEADVARQFMGFWKNFMNTFSLNGRKVYITGESYAGQYIPYIAAAMLDANNTDLYNVAGIQIIDPVVTDGNAQTEAPAVTYLDRYSNIFNLNDTFMAAMHERDDRCGYSAWMNNALTFPPAGPIPPAPTSNRPDCEVWLTIAFAAVLVNPCFNYYHITDFCPFLWDQLGFTLGWGPNNYFNRTDVQEAINAPPTNYQLVGNPGLFYPYGDTSPPSALGPLPSVIERTNNVIITNGLLDFLIPANGTLAAIQNMTWNGKQGFQTAPSSELNLFVPYHETLDEIIYQRALQLAPNYYKAYDVAGAGFLGVTHHERGLTWVTVNAAGHQMPQYTPGAAYRQLEFLLGRISSLEQRGDYTTQTGDFGN